MTTIAHSTLTGSDLHEPKGVAAAGSGTVYVANGLGSGTWSTPSSQVGAIKQSNLYTSSQTITIPAGCTGAYVQMWGASGGGGGAASAVYPTAGGGSGAYLESHLTGLTGGHTVIYTQGAGGTGGTAVSNVNNTGTAGAANTTLVSGTQTISTLTCPAGGGGQGDFTASGATVSDNVGNTVKVALGGAGATIATGGNIINLAGVGASATVVNGKGGQLFYSVGGSAAFGLGTASAGTNGGLIIHWLS